MLIKSLLEYYLFSLMFTGAKLKSHGVSFVFTTGKN